jgi:alcohol dehydrogenase class IV
MDFFYYAPTKVYFGELNIQSLVSEINGYGVKVLILTGGKSTSNIAKTIKDSLSKKFDIALYEGVTTNPLAEYIEGLSTHDFIPNVIITVGGGSVHDAGKALSIALTHDGKIEDYTVDGKFSVPGIKGNMPPVITIPTISGTGAEVSPASLVRIGDQKRVIFSPFLYPKATFIDFRLAKSLSVNQCRNTAIDALVQGAESLVSTASQSFSKRYSCSAIKRTVNALIMLNRNGLTESVLEELALASIESLYAVGQSTVGAAHAISDPLSGIFNIHHGIAVGTLFPYVAEVNYDFAKAGYDELKLIIEDILEIKTPSIKDAIHGFYDTIGFDYHAVKSQLDKCGFTQQFNKCVKDSYNGDMNGNPRELNDQLIGRILHSIME